VKSRDALSPRGLLTFTDKTGAVCARVPSGTQARVSNEYTVELPPGEYTLLAREETGPLSEDDRRYLEMVDAPPVGP